MLSGSLAAEPSLSWHESKLRFGPLTYDPVDHVFYDDVGGEIRPTFVRAPTKERSWQTLSDSKLQAAHVDMCPAQSKVRHIVCTRWGERSPHEICFAIPNPFELMPTQDAQAWLSAVAKKRALYRRGANNTCHKVRVERSGKGVSLSWSSEVFKQATLILSPGGSYSGEYSFRRGNGGGGCGGSRGRIYTSSGDALAIDRQVFYTNRRACIAARHAPPLSWAQCEEQELSPCE